MRGIFWDFILISSFIFPFLLSVLENKKLKKQMLKKAKHMQEWTHATQVQEWTHENAKHIKHTQERKRKKQKEKRVGVPRRE